MPIQVTKRKWTEFFELSIRGYSSFMANPITADRTKTLLEELCNNDAQFSKCPQFKRRCKIFLEQFLGRIKAYQQDKEKIAALTALEEECLQSFTFVMELDQTLQGNASALQALLDKHVNLP